MKDLKVMMEGIQNISKALKKSDKGFYSEVLSKIESNKFTTADLNNWINKTYRIISQDKTTSLSKDKLIKESILFDDEVYSLSLFERYEEVLANVTDGCLI